MEASCKTSFIVALLAELMQGGHRTLVFSQSRVMLDIIQAATRDQSWPCLRIDGTVTSAQERAVSLMEHVLQYVPPCAM